MTAANGTLGGSTCRLAMTCGGEEGSVRVWDTTTWDQIIQFQVGEAGAGADADADADADGGGGGSDSGPSAVSLAAPQTPAGSVTPAAWGMLSSINARFPNVTWAAVGQRNGGVNLFRLDEVKCVAQVCMRAVFLLFGALERPEWLSHVPVLFLFCVVDVRLCVCAVVCMDWVRLRAQCFLVFVLLCFCVWHHFMLHAAGHVCLSACITLC